MAGYAGRLLSQPVEIHFAGFRSDTLRLQHEGWQLSAEQDVVGQSMRIALRHEKLGLLGLTHMERWHYEQYYHDARYMGRVPLPVLSMEHFGRRQTLFAVSNHLDPMGAFAPIDAVPSFTMTEPRALEDLVHFANLNQKRILLPEETVGDLMERILKLQEPARQARFLEEAKAGRTQPRLEAQLLSFAA